MSGCRRYPMKGIANFRDLGGYPCRGGMTRWGIFYRSTSLCQAEPEDLEILKELGISDILDLRYEHEREQFPDRYPDGITYTGLSLMGPTPVTAIKVNSSVAETKTLIRMYRQMIHHSKQEIGTAIKTMIDAEGAALFHCAAGKDRTGILAMLLLAGVGVATEDIIADYEISHNYISDFTSDRSGSHRSNMELLVGELEESYGTVNNFLAECSISEADLEALHKKFVVGLRRAE